MQFSNATAGWMWGSVTFLGSLITHIVVWRWLHPRRDVLWLAGIFLVLPLAATAFWFPWLNASASFPLCAAVTHFILAANYIAFYPAVQASSPSLRILVLLRQSPTPLGSVEITKAFSTENLFSDRIADLQTAGLIKKGTSGSQDELSWTGKALAATFVAYRNFIGLSRGKG